MDKASDRFGTYDQSGRIVHDYRFLLDFGAQFEAPVIWVARTGASWNVPTTITYGIWWLGQPIGLAQPANPSGFIISARRVGGDSVRMKVVSVSGELLSDFELAGDWNEFRLSPRRGYLVAEQGFGEAIVVRLSDNTVVWRDNGWEMAFFSPDEAHFISASDLQVPFKIVELATGRATEPDLATLPFPFDSDRRHVFVAAALDSGAVIAADYGYAETLTNRLWWVDWQAKLSPFDPGLPLYVYEEFTRWDPAGSKALWFRAGTPNGKGPPGYYELDISTMQSRSWTDVGGPWPSSGGRHIDSTDCFDPSTTTFFGTEGESLLACDCGNGDCQPIAKIPASSAHQWEANVGVSPDRRLVVVFYYWMGSSSPTTWLGPFLFRSSGGEPIYSGLRGGIQFDRLNQIILTGCADADGIGIVDRATDRAACLPPATYVDIVYE